MIADEEEAYFIKTSFFKRHSHDIIFIHGNIDDISLPRPASFYVGHIHAVLKLIFIITPQEGGTRKRAIERRWPDAVAVTFCSLCLS